MLCRRISSEKSGDAVSVACDLSDVANVRRAATEILGLNLSLAGLVNNAGIMQTRPTRRVLRAGYVIMAHESPWAVCADRALSPHLPDGARVVFIVSGVETQNGNPPKSLGFAEAATSPRRRARVASGSPEALRIEDLMHMQRRSSVPCHGSGVRPRDTSLAFQRGGTRLQSCNRFWARCQCLVRLFGEVHALAALHLTSSIESSTPAAHRTCDHQRAAESRRQEAFTTMREASLCKLPHLFEIPGSRHASSQRREHS